MLTITADRSLRQPLANCRLGEHRGYSAPLTVFVAGFCIGQSFIPDRKAALQCVVEDFWDYTQRSFQEALGLLRIVSKRRVAFRSVHIGSNCTKALGTSSKMYGIEQTLWMGHCGGNEICARFGSLE